MPPQPVTDVTSNAPEQIHRAAKVIGRSALARAVFDAIHTGKRKAKTVTHLMKKTGLTHKEVLMQGKKFTDSHLIHSERNGEGTTYFKNDFFHRHKAQVLSMAGNKRKLDVYPTKRNPSGGGKATTVVVRPRAGVKPPTPTTIDDIDSFSKVRKIKASGNLPTSVSEKVFKLGVRNILGETGAFTDWGGEKNDLFSTRFVLGGKRHAVAFGFKGPATRGELVPKKMGKNGDQIQRLFETDADVFFVQYWREINESVRIQMQAMAVNKTAMTGRRVWYGIIDGQDSKRLLTAYLKKFKLPKSAIRAL